ncbi:retrovirus-related pol polyprotein from transposon TNT 1-94 [Tanacetum coccineum]
MVTTGNVIVTTGSIVITTGSILVTPGRIILSLDAYVVRVSMGSLGDIEDFLGVCYTYVCGQEESPHYKPYRKDARSSAGDLSRYVQKFHVFKSRLKQIGCCCKVHISILKFPTGRVVVPTGRYVVPAGKVIIIVSPGRLSLVPTGRILSPDADHAGCLDTRKSTSGGIQLLGDKLVRWMSKKQDCIAMSLAEADISLQAVIKESPTPLSLDSAKNIQSDTHSIPVTMEILPESTSKLFAGTDIAKISRKRSKPDKHGYGKGKRIQEPGECYQRSTKSTPSQY